MDFHEAWYELHSAKGLPIVVLYNLSQIKRIWPSSGNPT